jgi:hypothetical protein
LIVIGSCGSYNINVEPTVAACPGVEVRAGTTDSQIVRVFGNGQTAVIIVDHVCFWSNKIFYRQQLNGHAYSTDVVFVVDITSRLNISTASLSRASDPVGDKRSKSYWRSMAKMLEREDDKAADAYEEKHSDIIDFYKDVNKIDSELKEINAEIRYYGESKDTGLTPDLRR